MDEKIDKPKITKLEKEPKKEPTKRLPKIAPKKVSKIALKKEPKKYYEKRMWNGIRPVFCCLTCSRQTESEDDMILHVASHYPDALDELLKE